MGGISRDRDRRLGDVALWQVPRLLFVGSALWLTFVSASGWSATGLTIALGVFGFCSLIFVGRQIIWGHRTSTGLVLTGAGLCAAGAVVLATYGWVVKIDVLPLLGSVLLVLGLGWLVEAWRDARPDDGDGASLRLWGVVLLVVAVLVCAVTALLLFTGTFTLDVTVLVVIGLALLVVLPVSVNLLSERGLRWISSRQPPGRFRTERSPYVSYLAGTVLAAAAGFAIFLFLTDWVLTAAVVAIAVVLVVAVVSNTHADVALVLAVLALLAAAPLEKPTPDTLTAQADTDTLVALGDSYMSGEGASTYYAGTDDAGRDQCRRAPTAYAARLVVAAHRYHHLAFLGCSGARTYNVIGTADGGGDAQIQPGETGTQVDQIKALKKANSGFDPKLVIVGIGGNDAGFATIGEICVVPGDCSSQRALFERNLPAVRRALVATYSSIEKALPGIPVVAIPYPQPIADSQRCDGVALTRPERNFIRSFVDQLDSTIRAAADQAGILYAAEMKDSLAVKNLQLCAVSKSSAGLNFVDVHSVNGLTAQRYNPSRWLHNSLHPNDRGHAAMLETLETWLDANAAALTTTSQRSADLPDPTVASGAAVTEPEPPCSMTVSDNPSCQRIARQWETQQLRNRAWWIGGAVLAGLLLLWAASMVILGRLRTAVGDG